MFDAGYWGAEYFGVEYWPPVIDAVVEVPLPTGGTSKSWVRSISRREAQILQEDKELITYIHAFLTEINQ